VDLGDKRSIDESRLLIQLLVKHRRIFRGEPFAYRIVFADEQRLQDGQTPMPLIL
jgi:hypothetical protein